MEDHVILSKKEEALYNWMLEHHLGVSAPNWDGIGFIDVDLKEFVRAAVYNMNY